MAEFFNSDCAQWVAEWDRQQHQHQHRQRPPSLERVVVEGELIELLEPVRRLLEYAA